MSNKLSLLIVAAVASLALVISLNQKDSESNYISPLGAAIEKNSYDVIGTASASSTLSGAYTSNRRVIDTKYQTNLHLDIQYRVNSNTSTAKYAEILVEQSNDGGTTFFPLCSKNIGTTEVDCFTESVVPDSRYTDAGIPIIFPGDKTSVVSTTYLGGIDLDILADQIRISARESASGTGSFGSMYIRATTENRQ